MNLRLNMEVKLDRESVFIITHQKYFGEKKLTSKNFVLLMV